VPRHVARLVAWLVAPLVVDYSASRGLVVDYSVRRDFVLRPHWVYFSHTVPGDILVSRQHWLYFEYVIFPGRIASTIHLD
jgi:hypothetical protein